MKTITSISLSFLFFFQGISVDMDVCDQIHKVSSFFMHYNDHKVYGDSFLEYVLEDYIHNSAKDKGHHNNSDKEHTPIHSHHACCHPVVFIINTNTVFINRLKLEKEKPYSLYRSSFSSRYLESLFQPPQV